MSRYN
jgi:hypothetical protein